jgi:HlyD family secretion protein
MLLVVLLAAAAVAVGGVTSPLWIKSPQQVAADARPPSPGVLTAPVERRVIRDVVVLRGDVRPGRAVDVTPASRTGGPGIVTAVKVNRGDQVKSGTVVLEVNGRPLIALPGDTPAFRDLKPGASGKDVTQLQAALAQLGHDPHEHDGVFGPATKQALSVFYRSLGYDPMPVSEGDDKQLAELRRQVTAAERQVADAQDAVSAAKADGTATPERKAAAAKALTRAREDLATIRNDLAETVRVTGAMLPQGEYTFLPRFPATVDALKASLGSAVVAPLVTFSTGDPVVRATLTTAQRALCKPGASVGITGDGALSAKGTVATIGELAEPSADGAATGTATSGYPMVITPVPALDSRYAGQNVRLSIEVAVSGGEELVVPISAIYGAANGLVYVTKRTSDGREQRVEVEPGLSAQGFVAVTVKVGQLEPGDVVTVGDAG